MSVSTTATPKMKFHALPRDIRRGIVAAVVLALVLVGGLIARGVAGGTATPTSPGNFYGGSTSTSSTNPAGYVGAPNATSATVLPYHSSVMNENAPFGSSGEVTADTDVQMNCWGTNSAGERLFNVTILDGAGAGTTGNVPGYAVADQWLSSPAC